MKQTTRLIDTIRAGDPVTISTPHGSTLRGRAVMRSACDGWVLNLGGRHGTPGIATNENTIRVGNAGRDVPATAAKPVSPFRAAIEINLAATIKAERNAGTMSMGARNLLQIVKTPSHGLQGAPQGTNAQWVYAQIFAETLAALHSSLRSFVDASQTI